MATVFLISLLVFFLIMPVRMIYPTERFNPITLSTLLGFVLYYIATYMLCKKKQITIQPKIVLLIIVLALSLLQLPLRIVSFEDTLVTFPDFLINLLGIFFGYLSFVKRKAMKYLFVSGLLLCIFMWIWGYTFFSHWENFGTITGVIDERIPEDVYMADKDGNKTSLYQNRGRILVLDCWHEGCGFCFKQLPRFQRLFDKYKEIDNLRFYTLGVAFNDSINLFDVLNKRNINLPSFVIRGKNAEKLGIKFYPAIIIIDEHSRKIFMGNLSNCESFLKKRFNKNKPSNELSTFSDTEVQDTIRMLSLRPDSLRSQKNNLSGNPHSPFNLFTL